jgi:hypothetical protein
LAFSSYLYSGHYAFAQADQTESKLQAANNAVEQAFNAVLDAEKAGANVTSFLVQLNVAAGDLAQAENSYHAGDSNTAVVQADSVLPIAQDVTNSAQGAQQAALVSGQRTVWLTITFSLIGAFELVFALFLVWRQFKRRYMKKFLDLKPEVDENKA